MKVALLGPYPVQLDPSRGGPPLPGGVDAVVVALARGLARRPGVEVHVITAAPGLPAARTYAEGGCTVHAVPRARGGRLTGQRGVVRALAATLDEVAPDVSHAHIAGVHARAALAYERAAGVPAVITLHGIIRREMQQAWPVTPWSTRLRWLADVRFEGRVVRDAREIISISPYVLDEFRSKTSARFHTIENPVDDRFFDVAPLPGQERLLCVARVIPRKGIAALVRAFGQVAQARPAAHLTVVGETTSDPAYAAHCQDLARWLGVAGRVAFPGAQPPDELVRRYAGADLFVLASEQETAPVSIAEAMAAGRPVLTTDTGGCAAMVVDGVGGRVVPPRDPAAFARAAIALLAEPGRLQAMGRSAHEAAEARFRLDSAVEKTLRVYEHAQAAGGRITAKTAQRSATI